VIRVLAAATVAATMLALLPPAAAIDVPVPGTSARVDVSGYVDGLAVAELGGPQQRPQAITELRFDSKLTRALRAHLTLRGRVGGPFEDAHAGIMDFVHEFQDHSPSAELNEAYLELREGDFQLKAGVQKFAWGKLDGLPPTDVLTPRDLHDPLVRDVEESKIGIPAIQATYFLPAIERFELSELRAQLVYVPIAVPTRLALADERWFPPTVISRSEVVIGANAASAALGGIPIDGPAHVPIRFHTQNRRPPLEFDAGGIAARIGGTWRAVDWDLYHYSGPETGPNAELHVLAVCDRGTTLCTQNGHLRIHAPTYLRQAHDTIHMTGADFSTAFGGLTVRGEIAGFVDRPYLVITNDLTSLDALRPILPQVGGDLARDLANGRRGRARVPIGELFPDRDSIEWGLGVDYLIEGFIPLFQVNQIAFVDRGPEQLYSNPETRLLGSVRKRFLQDTLEVELRTVYAIERSAWFAYPRVAYRYGDHWRFRLGYLAIGGPKVSYIGQFHDNDEFTLEARYSF
jgi:hypothetical protein